jgi:hypothetical protein
MLADPWNAFFFGVLMMLFVASFEFPSIECGLKLKKGQRI